MSIFKYMLQEEHLKKIRNLIINLSQFDDIFLIYLIG